LLLGLGLWGLIGLATAATLSLLGAGCGSRSIGEAPVIPEPAVAAPITLEIYSDGYGTLIETRTVDTEGPVVIDPVEEQPYSEPAQYYVFARAEGFYTELYTAAFGDTVHVDLDAVPPLGDGLAGVVFHGDTFFAPCYHDDARLAFLAPEENGIAYQDGRADVVQRTDAQGRFGLADLAHGDWLLTFDGAEQQHQFTLPNGPGTDYQDIVFYDEMIARAPNLYLYPTAETDVSVSLGFPQGGHVVESAPPYGDGWQVSVTPDGVVEGRYPYLFYEAALPRRLQTRQGWVIPGDDLAGGFAELLGAHGFVGREIDDFVEHWVPLLQGAPAYALYPQDADALVTLDIRPAPQRLRRLWLLVRALPGGPVALPPPPDPAPFSREGYFALEWGVIWQQ
jgi:hypothetical protein